MVKAADKWLVSAKALDRSILEEIYDTLHPELYRYAFRLAGSHEQALDIVSETFTRFIKSLRENAGPARNIRAYLYRIVHNLAMDRFRYEQRVDHKADPERLIAGEESDPLLIAQRVSDADLARQALWELTTEQRQVIVLKYLQNLSSKEIGAIIEKPPGAVRALQHRGLKAMRLFIDERLAEGNKR